MRFGHFFYPMKFDDSDDYRAIQDCLAEATLAEELGYDAVWLAEHYFTGECVYGDPLVFASAVAVQTTKIEIGFGILELPLHNPVRVAIQTALLDNLCQGRLIVGTAKGSNYNAYEYIGFGSNPDIGVKQLEEAEELLIRAWTTDNLEFKGEHFEVSVPAMRPRPYQKPHPRLARACLNTESIAEMARIGRPVLLRGRSTNHVGDGISLYRETMEESGYNAATVEANLDQIWVWREIHLAETDEQALDEFLPAFHDAYVTMEGFRNKYNPPEYAMDRQTAPIPREMYGARPDPGVNELMVGSPERVAEQLRQLREAGVRNLMLTNRGLMSLEKTARSMRLMSERVMPLLRD